MAGKQKDNTLFVSTIILIVFHLVGIIGIHTAYKELFLKLTPLNLLLSCSLLYLNHKEMNKGLSLFGFLVFSLGFMVEAVGVNTGLIFGDYYYGNTLGFKLLNVPLIIGFNWVMLIYSVGCICNNLKSTVFVKSLLGASMLVLLDLLIEPVAIKYDFWHWATSSVPLRNYAAWFVTSLLFLIIFNKIAFNKNNKLAKTLYIVQLVFFALLSCL